MEPAMYTLLAALGGVVITQLFNILLEDKKSKNILSIKEIEFKYAREQELLSEKKIAFVKYLEAG